MGEKIVKKTIEKLGSDNPSPGRVNFKVFSRSRKKMFLDHQRFMVWISHKNPRKRFPFPYNSRFMVFMVWRVRCSHFSWSSKRQKYYQINLVCMSFIFSIEKKLKIILKRILFCQKVFVSSYEKCQTKISSREDSKVKK